MGKETRFDVLLRQGRVMKDEEQEAAVRALFLDERFAGVIGFVERIKREYVDASCDQSLASSPGKQSHAWGSVDALRALMDRLREATARGSRKREEGLSADSSD
jgi:hypothetical protein